MRSVQTTAKLSQANLSHAALSQGDGRRLVFEGTLDAASLGQIWPRAVRVLEEHRPQDLIVDAAGVTYCDGAGVGLLVELRRLQEERGGSIEIEGLADETQRLLEPFARVNYEAPKEGKRRSAPEEIGVVTASMSKDLVNLIAFTGELVAALLHAVLHPRQVRWSDSLLTAERTGVNALPIVALISFLMGLIMGFQSAVAMRPYGADIYVPSLVAIIVIRELGPLMTAIILAGRTGSAFAAELGTMKVNEEIDALTTMGIDPVKHLVVSRVIAAVLMTPLLTIYANVWGLVGGAVVFLSSGYPLVTYNQQVMSAIGLSTLLGGLAKTLVFGFVVGGVGCLRGLETLRGASAVGVSTTRAVVAGIFLIILTDCVFSVTYYFLGI